MAKTTKPVDQLTYEQALQELDEILASLEGETRGLDATMEAFERGRALLQHCQALLDQAELKVRMLDKNEEIRDIED